MTWDKITSEVGVKALQEGLVSIGLANARESKPGKLMPESLAESMRATSTINLRHT